MREDRKFWTLRGIFITCLLFLSAGAAFGQAAAGYSEYFLPGDEQNMYFIFNDLDVNAGATGMHSVTSVVAWSANTTIYYDHWENGYNFDPIYPAEARKAKVSGTVFISAVIATDGTVKDARVIRSAPLFDKAALEAVQQWVYTPTLLNGVPVEVQTEIDIPVPAN